ncbi:MAG: hypothetical protein ACOY46_04110 [Bacillota bacterium]
MSDDPVKYANMEETFLNLIRNGANGMDHGNLLIMLSLVNMMGIINLINYRAGLKKSPDAYTAGPGESGGAKTMKDSPFDPTPLLSMLGGKQGPGISPGQIEGLFKSFMGPAPGQQEGKSQGEAVKKEKSLENQTEKKPEKSNPAKP